MARRRVRQLTVGVVAALFAALLPATASASATTATPAPARWPSDAVPGSLLVSTADGHVSDVHVAKGQEAVRASELKRHPNVLAVEPDYVRHTMQVPNDPSYAQQWSHVLTHAPAAWDTTTGSSSVTVAVIDTGIDATHPDLAANVVGQADASTGNVTTVPLGTNNDPCNEQHGTFVAGVIGAVGNNGTGVAGVAWHVGILDIAASDRTRCGGSFSDSSIIAAIQYAVSKHVDVINMSLGGLGDTCPFAYQGVIDDARKKGVTVVAAAGNSEQDFPGTTAIPASCNGVIAAGAVGQNGAHSIYSNANDYVDVVAPGGDSQSGNGLITSTVPGGGLGQEEGTSFASPYVVGMIALMKSVRPTLTPDQVEQIVEGTTQNAPATHSPSMGWGLVDVAAAVQAASSGTIPAAKPHADFPAASVVRVNAPTLITDPIRQAVAVSQYVFQDAQAEHVVLARPDNFADGLGGSALAFGVGPVLFTPSNGGLDSITESEIQRVLPPGGRVYVLGGTAAIPSAVDGELRGLGYQVVRLAGTNRMDTARLVAAEVDKRVQELGFQAPDKVMLATAFNWPDAVTAGSFGALFGYPILLTDPNQLSPETQNALASLHPDEVDVVGGTAAVSDAVLSAAASAAGGAATRRLAGVDRDATAIVVAKRLASVLNTEFQIDPLRVVAVNLRRSDGFTHVLSASALVGTVPGVFLPIEGDGGTTIPTVTSQYACQIDPLYGIVAGGGDVIADTTKSALNGLLSRSSGC